MISKAQAIMSISLFVILMAASCSTLPSQYYDDGISDGEYIRIAAETQDAQAFLAAYPDADLYVDREGRLAVDFRYDVVKPASTEQHWQGIRLRVFIDPQDRQVTGAFLDCKDASGKQKYVESGLNEYLNQYVENQTCP